MAISQELCPNLASIQNITNNPFGLKLSEAKAKRTLSPKMKTKSKRCRRISMKKRARVERNKRPLASRNGRNEVVRKVKVLKKLVPNCMSTKMETVFQETADYILALQMRVKVMQIMVNILEGSDEKLR